MSEPPVRHLPLPSHVQVCVPAWMLLWSCDVLWYVIRTSIDDLQLPLRCTRHYVPICLDFQVVQELKPTHLQRTGSGHWTPFKNTVLDSPSPWSTCLLCTCSLPTRFSQCELLRRYAELHGRSEEVDAPVCAAGPNWARLGVDCIRAT